MKDGQISALERMQALARFIRRRGTADEAAAIAPLEIQIEQAIKERTTKLGVLSHVEQPQTEAKAA